MLVRCPLCNSKSRRAATENHTDNTRSLHCQCNNLNCSTTFTCTLEFELINRKIKPIQPKQKQQLNLL